MKKAGISPLLTLLLLIGGCDPFSNLSGQEYLPLKGVVQDPHGIPLEGIYIDIEGRTTVTARDGVFRLDSLQPGEKDLLLHGERGTGRYRINLSENQIFDFTYPVTTTIVLLHDNDQHFNFNHKEQFIEEVQRVRQEYENVWLLNAGDIFVRHADRWPAPLDTSYYARETMQFIEIMNRVGYDAMAPGNHEFDYIQNWTGQSLRSANFALVAANVDVATNLLPQNLPYVTFETRNGLSLAVLGLSVGRNKPGVSVRDIMETAGIYRYLAEENDLFIALTHIGYARDVELAETMPELDVIIGGHSHTLLETAETVNGVLVAQAGGPPPRHGRDPDWPKYLGKVTIIMENDRVAQKYGEVITIEAIVEAGL